MQTDAFPNFIFLVFTSLIILLRINILSIYYNLDLIKITFSDTLE